VLCRVWKVNRHYQELNECKDHKDLSKCISRHCRANFYNAFISNNERCIG